jgi:hypothetical protein
MDAEKNLPPDSPKQTITDCNTKPNMKFPQEFVEREPMNVTYVITCWGLMVVSKHIELVNIAHAQMYNQPSKFLKAFKYSNR